MLMVDARGLSDAPHRTGIAQRTVRIHLSHALTRTPTGQQTQLLPKAQSDCTNRDSLR